MALTNTVLFPYAMSAPSRVTPFTYADGQSFLEKLEAMRRWLNETLALDIDAKLVALLEDFSTGLANAETVVTEAKAGWETLFDAYMVDVNASLMALNDQAMSDLIENGASEAGKSLIAGFVRRSPAGALYVDPVAGVDTNTGLTALVPLRTVGEAFKRIEKLAQDSETEWVISLAPGVYTERVRPAMFTPHALKVTIQGPAVGHPSTPLVIFTEGTGAVALGMFFSNPNGVITVKDIKFVGYNGSTSSCGISSTDGQLFTVNVHAENCYFGTSGANGILNMKGGVIDNCGRLAAGGGNGAGTRSQFSNFHYIGLQGAGNLNSGPIYRNCVNGVFAQEFSTGHVEYVTLEDNVNALALNVNSRINAEGSSFKRNNNDINARGNSHVNIPATVQFGTGDDKSGQVTVIAGGSQAPSAKAINVDTSYSRTLAAVNGIYNPTTVTGTTVSVEIYNKTLIAPWFSDTTQVSGTPPKRLKLRTAGTITGIAGSKLLVAKIGALATSVTFSASEAGAFSFEAEIIFASPTRQIITGVGNRHFNETGRMGVNSGSENMAVDKSLILNASVSNAADSIVFEFVELYLG